jgi:formylglycine-generating enzyme required for sulfatase activity
MVMRSTRHTSDLGRAFLTAAAAAVVAAGCSESGWILVEIDGNLQPGLELDALTVRISADGEEVDQGSFPFGEGSSFPQTVSLRSGDRIDDEVDVTVTATLITFPLVSATRTIAFQPGRTVEERMCLYRHCIGLPTTACLEGTCLETPPDADADADADGDGDADGDSDSDEEADAEGDRDVCVPDCEGRQCGDDGCGDTCEPGCEPGERCEEWSCVLDVPEEWVLVTHGTFFIGSPEAEAGHEWDEELHEVTLTRDYWMLATEVTRNQFIAITGYDPQPTSRCGPDCPVGNVTWHEAAAFCNRLSNDEDMPECYTCTGTESSAYCTFPVDSDPYDCQGYRLPTEAEWERAARGGTSTATYNGDLPPSHIGCARPNPVLDTIAWTCANSGNRAHPVAQLEPNGFGLYDILGSVWEWCHDIYGFYELDVLVDPSGTRTGLNRVDRGGSYSDTASCSRAADRYGMEPSSPLDRLGFRPVRTVP